MRGISTIVLPVVVALCSATVAYGKSEIPACVAKFSDAVFHVEAYDMDGGMTAIIESIGDDETPAGSFLVVHSCHTGRFMRATIFSEVTSSKTGKVLKRNEFPAVLDELDSAREPESLVTLEQFFERFEADGVPVTTGISRVETCACAESYPGLRGTKQGFIKR